MTGSTKTIYVVRHGQCLDNARNVLNGQRDTALTPLGKKQARAAAAKLKSAKIKIIFSSPLRRARQTAAVLKRELGTAKIIILPELVERDVGVLSGLPTSEATRRASKIWRAGRPAYVYILAGQGVESFPATYRRARQAWKKLQRAAMNGSVAVVTHGDLGTMLRAVARGWTWRRGLAEKYLTNCQVIKLQGGK